MWSRNRPELVTNGLSLFSILERERNPLRLKCYNLYLVTEKETLRCGSGEPGAGRIRLSRRAHLHSTTTREEKKRRIMYALLIKKKKKKSRPAISTINVLRVAVNLICGTVLMYTNQIFPPWPANAVTAYHHGPPRLADPVSRSEDYSAPPYPCPDEQL